MKTDLHVHIGRVVVERPRRPGRADLSPAQWAERIGSIVAAAARRCHAEGGFDALGGPGSDAVAAQRVASAIAAALAASLGGEGGDPR